MDRKLTKKETNSLIKIIQERWQHSPRETNNAFRSLMSDYEGLVKSLAKLYYTKRKDVTDMQDLISAGWFGFFKAVHKYNRGHESGAQFITFVHKGIQTEVLGAFRKQVDIREVEANTFSDMAKAGSDKADDSAVDDGLISGLSLQRTGVANNTTTLTLETEGGMQKTHDTSLLNELRSDPHLSVSGSILMFTKRGMGTTEIATKQTAKQFSIKSEDVHLSMAEQVRLSFKRRGKVKK